MCQKHVNLNKYYISCWTQRIPWVLNQLISKSAFLSIGKILSVFPDNCISISSYSVHGKRTEATFSTVALVYSFVKQATFWCKSLYFSILHERLGHKIYTIRFSYFKYFKEYEDGNLISWHRTSGYFPDIPWCKLVLLSHTHECTVGVA